MKTLIFLIATLSLATCSDSKKQMDVSSLLNKELKVISINKTSVEELNLTMSLAEAETSVNGFAGCNKYFGTYTIEENNITFSGIGKTKMYCQDAMETESSYINALENTATYKIAKDGKIELYDENGTLLITLSL